MISFILFAKLKMCRASEARSYRFVGQKLKCKGVFNEIQWGEYGLWIEMWGRLICTFLFLSKLYQSNIINTYTQNLSCAQFLLLKVTFWSKFCFVLICVILYFRIFWGTVHFEFDPWFFLLIIIKLFFTWLLIF